MEKEDNVIADLKDAFHLTCLMRKRAPTVSFFQLITGVEMGGFIMIRIGSQLEGGFIMIRIGSQLEDIAAKVD
ncbi:hypothetical protein TSUD_47140 [Trifolium subterraneum]|nr:hypothetical protein TSUD_47140 [Trifolium subterraneum]